MATIEGTKQHFEKYKDIFLEGKVNILGKTGYSVSCLGFGGYRVSEKVQSHAESMILALQNGINLIDTSSNYMNGGSEHLTGQVINEMISREFVTRDELVVVTKAGYIQGQNMMIATSKDKQGKPYPDVVKYTTDCWHCINPEFLQDQLELSLARLNTGHIDVYLLHNPEYFLTDMKHKGIPFDDKSESEYYRRIKLAFEWMEEKVAEGRINYYGVSSNTFPSQADDPEFTSLEKIHAIAEEISPDNHFAVIQFPFNLYEKEAHTVRNQNDSTFSLLNSAMSKNIATLVNRPLNALKDGKMVRLASFTETDETEVKKAIADALKSIKVPEKELIDDIIPLLQDQIPQDTMKKVFHVSEILSGAESAFEDRSHWDYVKNSMLFPQVNSYIQYLGKLLNGNEKFEEWAIKYSGALTELCDAVSKHFDNEEEKISLKRSYQLDHAEPDLFLTKYLSQKALRVLTSFDSVDCVLVGMRHPDYVADAVQVFVHDNIPEADQVLEDFDV